MTITLEFNDDHDGLEMEMSEKKYSGPNLNNPFQESQTYTQKLTRTTFASYEKSKILQNKFQL